MLLQSSVCLVNNFIEDLVLHSCLDSPKWRLRQLVLACLLLLVCLTHSLGFCLVLLYSMSVLYKSIWLMVARLHHMSAEGKWHICLLGVGLLQPQQWCHCSHYIVICQSDSILISVRICLRSFSCCKACPGDYCLISYMGVETGSDSLTQGVVDHRGRVLEWREAERS